MIRINQPLRATLFAALLCGVSSASLLAQGPGGPPPGGEREHHHGPPPSPLFDALDTNHDGVISADEMSNAAASLKGLLKDGKTELRRDDLRPAPPHHGPGDDPAANENDHPRGKVPAIRPHGPVVTPDQADTETGDKAAPAADDAAAKPGPREGDPEHRHHGPPPSPVFDALDTNHDGAISTDEMDKATASLKGLLKPGTSELRREDLRPMHPPHHPEE